MDIPPWATVVSLIAFVVIGLIPMIPGKLRILILLLVGAGVYLGLCEATFNLPDGDNLVISGLMGGSGDAGHRFAFNHLAMGFVGPVLGLLATGFSLGLQKLVGKKE